MTQPTTKLPQFVKFVAVGVFNTGFGYSIYALGLAIGLRYWLANLISLVIAMAVAFVAQGRLVFNHRDPRRLPRFIAMWAVLWVFNVSLISVILPRVDGNAYLAGALSLVVTTTISFLTQKYFVFAGKSAR